MSGITDEAAKETHDLIHDAEVKEERMHPDDAQNPQSGGTSQDKKADPTPTGDEGHQSTMDKVKEAFHMKK